MIKAIFETLTIWAGLNILALFLFSLRKDKLIFYEDLKVMLFKKPLYILIMNMVILFLLIPLTIPYTLSHFIKKK